MNFSTTLLLLTLSVTLSFAQKPHFREYQRRLDRLDHKASTLESSTAVEELWFTQTLDHFNPRDARTFQQRFYRNAEFFTARSGRPVFVYIGGEAELSSHSVQSGEIVELARAHDALLLGLEHRFYGRSQPFSVLSTDNLMYLSSQQALEDLAVFIQAMTSSDDLAGSRVFTVGGSYPGALSAWFRLRYPHLTAGSLASSAPIEAKLKFFEYDEIVAQSAGQECAAAIRSATMAVQTALFENPPQIKAQFRCLQVPDNVGFLYVLADAVSFSIQYTSDTPGTRYHLKEEMCSTFLSTEGSPVDRFAKFLDGLLNKLGQTCDDFTSTENVLKNTTVLPQFNQRQWYWQSCVEFGWFQVAPPENSLRSPLINLTYHLDLCERVFGMPMRPHVEATNTHYGGRSPVGTNVYMVNGDVDPWHALSRTTPLSCCDTIPTNLIPGTAHCADLHAPAESDPPALTAARADIAHHTSMWLADDTVTSNPDDRDQGDEDSNDSSWEVAFLVVGAVALVSLAGMIYAWRQLRQRTPALYYSDLETTGGVL